MLRWLIVLWQKGSACVISGHLVGFVSLCPLSAPVGWDGKWCHPVQINITLQQSRVRLGRTSPRPLCLGLSILHLKPESKSLVHQLTSALTIFDWLANRDYPEGRLKQDLIHFPGLVCSPWSTVLIVALRRSSVGPVLAWLLQLSGLTLVLLVWTVDASLDRRRLWGRLDRNVFTDKFSVEAIKKKT